jgi:hypothetical protein
MGNKRGRGFKEKGMKLLLAAAAIAVLVGAGLCSEVIIFNTASALAESR